MIGRGTKDCSESVFPISHFNPRRASTQADKDGFLVARPHSALGVVHKLPYACAPAPFRSATEKSRTLRFAPALQHLAHPHCEIQVTMIVPAPSAAIHASATTWDSPPAAAAVALAVPPMTSLRPTPSIALPGPMNWRLPRRPSSATRSLHTSPPCSNCLVVPPPDSYLAEEGRRPPATTPRHAPAAPRESAHAAWHALSCPSPLPVRASSPCPGTSTQPAPLCGTGFRLGSHISSPGRFAGPRLAGQVTPHWAKKEALEAPWRRAQSLAPKGVGLR